MDELKNLARTGSLKTEPADQEELDGLISSGRKRLKDSKNRQLSLENRFDLAYNASHSLSLAALRWHGYRPDKQRFIVFQALRHTLGFGPEVWRILDKAHGKRNDSEYEGYLDLDEPFIAELIKATEKVAAAVAKLGPIRKAVSGKP